MTTKVPPDEIERGVRLREPTQNTEFLNFLISLLFTYLAINVLTFFLLFNHKRGS